MNKIKIFALGGLDENGKNTYVIEVDESIFVFDCGLKYANEALFGIDYVIPSFDYLKKNKKRIKGIFITHGHYENMGALPDLLKVIPEVKVYASKFTKFTLLNEGIKEEQIIEIKANKKIGFGEVSIFPINVSHSIPDALMYVVNTKDGAIVYTGDFLIDPSMKESYGMDLGKVAYVGKQGVLALLSESVFSEREGHTSPQHRLAGYFKDVINRHEHRLMFSVLPNHLYTIQDIFNATENTHRKVVIMGKALQNIIDYSMKEGYLKVAPDTIGDLSNIKDDNVILLLSDSKEKQYGTIEKIINGYDKFITIKANDTIVFAEPRYDNSEKKFVKIQNEIAILQADSITIPKEQNILHHASKEDLMLMIRLINPKYYIPVKGEYRYMVGNADLAYELGMPKENILLKQNGDVINIIDKKITDDFETIKVNDVLIDGNSSDDVGELVIKDRELLSQNGIVLISATLNKKTKEILVEPEVTTRGFIYVKDSIDMIEEIKKISLEVIKDNISNNYVDYNKIKNEVRENLSNYLFNETGSKPMIIAVIQEI